MRLFPALILALAMTGAAAAEPLNPVAVAFDIADHHTTVATIEGHPQAIAVGALVIDQATGSTVIDAVGLDGRQVHQRAAAIEPTDASFPVGDHLRSRGVIGDDGVHYCVVLVDTPTASTTPAAIANLVIQTQRAEQRAEMERIKTAYATLIDAVDHARADVRRTPVSITEVDANLTEILYHLKNGFGRIAGIAALQELDLDREAAAAAKP